MLSGEVRVREEVRVCRARALQFLDSFIVYLPVGIEQCQPSTWLIPREELDFRGSAFFKEAEWVVPSVEATEGYRRNTLDILHLKRERPLVEGLCHLSIEPLNNGPVCLGPSDDLPVAQGEKQRVQLLGQVSHRSKVGRELFQDG